MAEDRLTVNCIGVGHWGPNMVRVFATHPRARVGAVSDLAVDRLELVRAKIPGDYRLSTDPVATATDPDARAVVISTPVESHHALAKAALEAGKHVLVEKPLCRTMAQGEELLALAKKKGVVLAVGHVFLFNSGIREVHRLIHSGELKDIQYLFATRTNLGPFRTDVNALWDLASHDISIFNFWLDAAPESVTAHGHCVLTPAQEDVVVATFRYPGGIMASIHASWLNPRKVREITLVSSNEMVVWNDMDLTEPVRIYHKSVAVSRESRYTDSFGAFRMQVRNGDVVSPYLEGREPLAAEIEHFIECVREGKTPLNSGPAGLDVVRALEAADRSLRERSVLVPT
jgi:predicted dehydrogenase